MHPEQALQKLNELRSLVDEDTEEMVDVLAKLMVLKQDISKPMYGAQVTLHRRPEGEWVDIEKEDLPLPVKMQVEDGESYTDYSNVENPWMWRVSKRVGSNYKEEYLEKKGRSADETWWELEKWMAYTEKEKVPRDDVPEPLDPEQPLEDDLEAAENMDGEWTIYEADFREYRRRRLVEPDSLESTNAIVYEPTVASAEVDQYWDPHKEEYTTPDDYPMGTVNVIVAESGELGTDSYVSGVEEVTSIAPADGEPGPLTYSPGWD